MYNFTILTEGIPKLRYTMKCLITLSIPHQKIFFPSLGFEPSWWGAASRTETYKNRRISVLVSPVNCTLLNSSGIG